MTINTFETVMTLFIKFYPNFKFNLNDDMQVELWFAELEYMNDAKAVLAAKKVISTCDFVTIKNIKQAYAEVDSPMHIDDEEGWGMVKKAISAYGYMRASEAMASLPSRVQKAVIYMGGFQAICESEKEDVVRGQFTKAMAAVNNRVRTEATLGQPLLEQIRSYQMIAEQQEHKAIEINTPLRLQENRMTCEEVSDQITSIKEILYNSRKVAN